MSEDSEVGHAVRLLVEEIIGSEVKVPAAFGITNKEKDDAVVAIVESALKDLTFLTEHDPAAYDTIVYVLQAYPGFHAVLHYRIANALLRLNAVMLEQTVNPLLIAARRISEDSKVKTGIEIHPAAVIAAPFAIDHGANTVIGETSIIGQECYFLQAVTLGGRAISGAEPGRRHPEIGNRVQIAGNSQIIGPIRIGNDVIVDPGAKITNDIADGSHVRVLSSIQVVRSGDASAPVIFGIVPTGQAQICVFGKRLGSCAVRIELKDDDFILPDYDYSANTAHETVTFSVENDDLDRAASGSVALICGDCVVARMNYTAALREIANV